MVNKQKTQTFELAMEELETIVNALEKGDLPLDDALNAFKKGVELSQYCQATLENAEETVAKLMSDDGELIPLEGDPS